MRRIFIFTLFSSVFAVVPVKNDDCTYEFDMEHNLIYVSCSKNVSLTIKEKDGAISLIQDPDDHLWFETADNGKNQLPDRFSSKSTKKLKDAARLLKRMKSTIETRMGTLENITATLASGDSDLRNDLTNIKQYPPTSTLMRESMVAALQNQYTYLQHAMLALNAEMKEMVEMMSSVATAAQKSVRSQLAMNDKVQEDVLLILASLAKANVTKIERKTDFCPQELVSIRSDNIEIPVGIAQGSFAVDPIPGGQIWVTYGYSDINEIFQYKSLELLKYDVEKGTHKLPFFCEGTGHVVYKNSLYCHKGMSNKIVKYNLLQKKWEKEVALDNAGVHNKYPYQSGKFSDIDFAVDEKGLWVIYATTYSNGNIVIVKLNDDTLEILETWVTNIPKTKVGNAFMICGVMYATDSYENIPTFIKYSFNTNNGGSKVLKDNQIIFPNTIDDKFAKNYMLDYNPIQKKLYAWNHGRVEVYSVSSKSYYPFQVGANRVKRRNSRKKRKRN
ncbi:Hypothetical predicted protein [Mytilus galloprovincialis]|uniref:Olfactomedin-like domain-containing protein n=1 Tax=Mytilus galloprovincialis TaxID=29158 RepID=A0A8B6BYT7_MYTGA|nr:Hypothetical predicted protein [Mytilus galloprovincialis]